jgi:hypothetical protein
MIINDRHSCQSICCLLTCFDQSALRSLICDCLLSESAESQMDQHVVPYKLHVTCSNSTSSSTKGGNSWSNMTGAILHEICNYIDIIDRQRSCLHVNRLWSLILSHPLYPLTHLIIPSTASLWSSFAYTGDVVTEEDRIRANYLQDHGNGNDDPTTNGGVTYIQPVPPVIPTQAPVTEAVRNGMDIVGVLNRLSTSTNNRIITSSRLTHLKGPLLMSSLSSLISQYNHIIDLSINIFQLNASEHLTKLQQLSYLQRLSITITPSQPRGIPGKRSGLSKAQLRPTHIDTPLMFACETFEISIPFIPSLTNLIIHTIANPTPDQWTHEDKASYTFILPLSLPHLNELVIDHRSSQWRSSVKFHKGDNETLSSEDFMALTSKKKKKKKEGAIHGQTTGLSCTNRLTPTTPATQCFRMRPPSPPPLFNM